MVFPGPEKQRGHVEYQGGFSRGTLLYAIASSELEQGYLPVLLATQGAGQQSRVMPPYYSRQNYIGYAANVREIGLLSNL